MDQANTAGQAVEVLEKVRKISAIADYHAQPHPEDDMLVISFDMGRGRSQMVYVRYIGQTPDGHDSVLFMSPCLELKIGLFSGLGRRRAVDLLRRNAQLRFGSFALFAFKGGTDVLMVVSSQIVDTMEVEEFKTHVNCVALVADEYERECGHDNF